MANLAMILCLFAVGSLAAAEVQDGFKGYKVYRLTITTERQLDFLVRTNEAITSKMLTDELEFWEDLSLLSMEKVQSVLAMVSPGQQAQFLEALDARGIQHEMTIPDLAKAIEEESRLTPEAEEAAASGRLTWDSYHQYHTMEAYLETLVAENPTLVQDKTIIGQSYEGRNMHLLKVGVPRPDGQEKPAIWIDGNIHAREWISSATVLYILNRLVTEYETDPMARRMMDEIDWYVLPVVNVDGFAWTHQAPSNRMWRKTRRLNPFHREKGSDPNRNYDHKWMVAGATQDASDPQIFAGPYPYSEIENLHVTEAMLERKTQLKCMLSFHSYSQLWLTPWAYGPERPDDYDDIHDAGLRAVAALAVPYGTRYRVGSPPAVLYSAAGGTLDFAKAKAGIKYSYTPELRDTGTYGFILPPAQIIPSGIETFEAVNVMAQIIYEEFGRK